MIKFKVKRIHPDAKLPTKAYNLDLGYDVYSLEDKVLQPGEIYKFHLGFQAEVMPSAWKDISYGNSSGEKYNHIIPGVFVFDKSGIGSKGVTKLAGVIESTYRGEYIVVLQNNGSESVEFKKGDKLCQLVILPVLESEVEEVGELTNSNRGSAGFGSSGR